MVIEAGWDVLASGLPILASSSDDEGGLLGLLLAGPAGAVAVYWMLFRYYRNTDKSHSYETETRVQAAPITGHEHKENEIRGTRRRRIQGENMGKHRERVKRLT